MYKSCSTYGLTSALSSSVVILNTKLTSISKSDVLTLEKHKTDNCAHGNTHKQTSNSPVL